MLLAGHADGVEGLSIADACAVTLAFFDGDWTQTGFTFNPKGRAEMLKAFGLPTGASAGVDNMAPPAELAEDQLAEFRASIKPKQQTE